MADRHGHIIFGGNRFNPWMVNIIKTLRQLDPQAQIWVPFGGTEKGFQYIKTVFADMDYVKIESDTDFLHKRYRQNQKDNKEDLEELFHKVQARLKPGAMNRIWLSDRFFGQAFVKTVHLEETNLTSQFHDPKNVRKLLAILVSTFLEKVEEIRPKSILCYCVAGSLGMSLWEIADVLGIPFRTIDFSRVDNYHHLGVSPFHSFEKIGKIFKTIVPTEEEREKSQAVIQEFRVKPDNNADWKFYSNKFNQLSPYRVTRSLIKNMLTYKRWEANVDYLPGAFTRIKNDAIVKIRARKDILNSDIQQLNELPEKFIYVPLHTDPEASTMVLAPYLQNQTQVIENLSRAFSLNYAIVVKEHIITSGWRTKAFYKEIKKLPNLYLASTLLPGPKIIEKASAVATITGTSGWQALILGKPVITYGRPFYEVVQEGFLRVKGWDDLADRWQPFIENFRPVKDETLIRFLSAIFRGSFKLSTKALWAQNRAEACAASHSNVINLIANELFQPTRSSDVPIPEPHYGHDISPPLV